MALLKNSSAALLVHNHPPGVAAPSRDAVAVYAGRATGQKYLVDPALDSQA